MSSDSDDMSYGMEEDEEEMELELSAAEWKMQGNEHYKSKEYDAAIDAYSNAIRKDSSNPAYFLNRSV